MTTEDKKIKNKTFNILTAESLFIASSPFLCFGAGGGSALKMKYTDSIHLKKKKIVSTSVVLVVLNLTV